MEFSTKERFTTEAVPADRAVTVTEIAVSPISLPEHLSPAAREALATARPEAEFAVSPVLTEEAKEGIAAVIAKHKIRPPRGWILIKHIPAAQRIGLILVPEAAEQPPDFGIVVAVGAGTYQNGQLVPPEVSIGNHVTFPKFAGIEVKVAGETLTQLREDEVMLIAG